MGTNYYLVQNECNCCKRHETVHIGKDCMGWKFSFHGLTNNIPHVMSWSEWQTEIKNSKNEKPIINEYDERLTLEEFSLIVERTRNAKLNHFDYCTDNFQEWSDRTKTGMDWKDEEGFSFCSSEFC